MTISYLDMEGIMRYFHIGSEYLPTVLFIAFFVWLFFGTNEILNGFLDLGKTYYSFDGFFCAGWAGICK
tara:strand:+ start:269 stop:475 length:207 start_codon:yes stop_codon:yes gene_type:complete